MKGKFSKQQDEKVLFIPTIVAKPPEIPYFIN
jgi:hypothetical protein